MEFHLTSTINVEAKDQKELEKRLDPHNDTNDREEIAWELLDNAEIDKAED
jgi:hypothetical protein